MDAHADPGGRAPPLPLELWLGVFSRLANSLDPPGGVRGPGIVAAVILRAGLTCRGKLQAVGSTLGALSAAVPLRDPGPQCLRRVPSGALPPPELARRPPCDPAWDRYDQLLRGPPDPGHVAMLALLRSACRQRGLPDHGSAAEQSARLRAHYGLPSHRCALPFRLWLARRQERATPTREGLRPELLQKAADLGTRGRGRHWIPACSRPAGACWRRL
ncbi:hypothetical protein HYH03_004377 [Edaphochlamys debaryana]|uniref:Uncharacterized protein n=1 Tax=Edaphochlamys debaryana TaxID=47281 RepID=A0A836C3B4_9CHLO|nr:hypothetical protein HYH03_004377 [Edaphochlamys debaryana]|eukprot:KAG2497638.1 hypothetical protein HYH03_004377 [Edaphochlamys debaryana]